MICFKFSILLTDYKCLSALFSTPFIMKASRSHELNAFIKVPQDGSSFLLPSPFYIATINNTYKNPSYKFE